jgi:transposase
LRIKKAATPKKTMGYGFNSLEKILICSKLTLEKNLLWFGENRTGETLEAFFDYLGQDRCQKLRAVCCDMRAPCIGAVKKRLPHALLDFYKFHIIGQILAALDKVRREEVRKLKSENPDLLNGTKYIWLKNPWNLTEKQKARLGNLERLNLKINRAYLLKEAFQKFWDYAYQAWAKRFLDQRFWWAIHSGLKSIRSFTWIVRRHQDDTLNYSKVRIDNGAVKGLNNKAKAIGHRAYGFRTTETFKLALYHVMGNLPMPLLTHTSI